MSTFFRAIFARRSFHRHAAIALLAYQFIFLNIFLPGHTRGAITLDGKHTGGCPACCLCGEPQANEKAGHDSKQAPSQRDKDNCAVCQFAARVLPATFVNLKLPELAFLELLPTPAAAVPVSLQALPTYLGRAPPSQA